MSRGRGAASNEFPGPPLAQVAALVLKTYRDAIEQGRVLRLRLAALDEEPERRAVRELYAAERARADVAKRLLAEIWGIRVGSEVATRFVSALKTRRQRAA